MKILFSLTYYSPYISGLTLYIKRLSEQLAISGHECSVLAFQHEQRLPLQEKKEGVNVFRVRPLIQFSKGYLSIDWVLQCVRHVRRNDYVVVSLPQPEGLIPAFIGRVLGKKVISIYHCEVSLPMGIFNFLIQMVLSFFHICILYLSHQIITYTRDYADNSQILPIFKDKVQTIYPPYHIPTVNTRVKNILSKKIEGRNHFVVGTVARLAAEKGIEYLLEAIPLIKANLKNRKLKIVMAGPMNPVGEESYKEKILHLVRQYRKDVVFLGELKESELGAFYSLLDCFVLPSINSTEAFGMVQVEAMLAGVPVVAGNLPGVRIPVRKTGMGQIVPIKNSQKLANAITDVLLHKHLYHKSRAIIEKEFSFSETVEFYKNLFK